MAISRGFRLVLLVVLLGAVAFVARSAWTTRGNPDDPQAGGRLRATYRGEPTNHIRMIGQPLGQNQMLSVLTQAPLLRTGVSGELEPRLASGWTPSADGLTWTVNLRPGAKFSDGTAVTSADVVFTVRAALDETTPSNVAGDLRVGGQPITVRALSDSQFVVTFPAPHGPGMGVFDNLPILPRHKLESALEGGMLPSIWTMKVAPAEVVGAGPFMLREYVPGQRLLFARNPHFFGRDAAGNVLPYLDELEVTIVPDANAELVRLQAGESDVIMDKANADDLAVLRQAESAGRVRLTAAGPSMDVSTLWFDLRPGAKSAANRPWLVAPEFRRAISHAVNRQAIVDTVYLGEATPVYGPVSPGAGAWYAADAPTTPYDQAQARTLLAAIGLTDRNGDNQLEDRAGQPVRFSIITRAGASDLEKTVAVVQEQLRQIGIAVDVVSLPVPEIPKRMAAGDFDAIYFGGRNINREPSPSFWLSSGGFHFWHPGQTTPATPWEGEIDALFAQQQSASSPAERHKIFAQMQRIVGEQLPAVWFVAPHVVVPVSGRVRGATPTIFITPVLWNAEVIHLADGGR